MNKTNKYILIGVGMAVALFFVWLMFMPSTVTVEATAVTRGDLLITVDAEGHTRFRDKFTVTAPVSGKMKRIDIREGDLLPRGYVITEIDPNPPSTRPPAETDGLINPYAQKVYSPVAGRVLQIMEKSERIIQAGVPILEIGNPGPVEIVIDVLSDQASRIRPGTNVLIESEAGTEPVKARVRAVEPQAITKISALGVEERRVNVIADIMSKDVRFGDNFRVDARIVISQHQGVLKVPISALFRNGEAWSVFVIQYGMAHRRDVAVGEQSSSEAVIVSGLEQGEDVILHPPNELTENAFVEVR